MSQAGGQFPKTRGLLATIYFAFLRHNLGDVAYYHQVSDDLSRFIARRRNSRTHTLSGPFAADLFVRGAAGLVDGKAGAELRNSAGVIRTAEDLGACAPDDLFRRRPDYVGEGVVGVYDSRIQRLHADAVLNCVKEHPPDAGRRAFIYK